MQDKLDTFIQGKKTISTATNELKTELLDQLQKELEKQFSKIAQNMNAGFDSIALTLEKQSEIMEGIKNAQEMTLAGIDKLQKQFEVIEAKVDKIDKTVGQNQKQIKDGNDRFSKKLPTSTSSTAQPSTNMNPWDPDNNGFVSTPEAIAMMKDLGAIQNDGGALLSVFSDAKNETVPLGVFAGMVPGFSWGGMSGYVTPLDVITQMEDSANAKFKMVTGNAVGLADKIWNAGTSSQIQHRWVDFTKSAESVFKTYLEEALSPWKEIADTLGNDMNQIKAASTILSGLADMATAVIDACWKVIDGVAATAANVAAGNVIGGVVTGLKTGIDATNCITKIIEIVKKVKDMMRLIDSGVRGLWKHGEELVGSISTMLKDTYQLTIETASTFVDEQIDKTLDLVSNHIDWTQEVSEFINGPLASQMSDSSWQPSADLCGFDPEQINVAAFNIQKLGATKMSGSWVPGILSGIIQSFDLVVIQEIQDANCADLSASGVPLKSNCAANKLLEIVNSAVPTEEQFDMFLSPRFGPHPTNGLEQYGFVYRKNKMVPTSRETVKSSLMEYRRNPFKVTWSLRGSNFQFVTFVLHAAPDGSVVQELDALGKEAVEAKNDNLPVLVLGDLNAGCTYVTDADWSCLENDACEKVTMSLWENKEFTWLLGNDKYTNLKRTCAYDRFVVTPKMLKHVVPGSAQVVPFDTQHTLSPDEALKVSDHYPISLSIQTNTPNYCLKGKYLRIKTTSQFYRDHCVAECQNAKAVNSGGDTENMRIIIPACASFENTDTVNLGFSQAITDGNGTPTFFWVDSSELGVQANEYCVSNPNSEIRSSANPPEFIMRFCLRRDSDNVVLTTPNDCVQRGRQRRSPTIAPGMPLAEIRAYATANPSALKKVQELLVTMGETEGGLKEVADTALANQKAMSALCDESIDGASSYSMQDLLKFVDYNQAHSRYECARQDLCLWNANPPGDESETKEKKLNSWQLARSFSEARGFILGQQVIKTLQKMEVKLQYQTLNSEGHSQLFDNLRQSIENIGSAQDTFSIQTAALTAMSSIYEIEVVHTDTIAKSAQQAWFGYTARKSTHPNFFASLIAGSPPGVGRGGTINIKMPENHPYFRARVCNMDVRAFFLADKGNESAQSNRLSGYTTTTVAKGATSIFRSPLSGGRTKDDQWLHVNINGDQGTAGRTTVYKQSDCTRFDSIVTDDKQRDKRLLPSPYGQWIISTSLSKDQIVNGVDAVRLIFNVEFDMMSVLQDAQDTESGPLNDQSSVYTSGNLPKWADEGDICSSFTDCAEDRSSWVCTLPPENAATNPMLTPTPTSAAAAQGITTTSMPLSSTSEVQSTGTPFNPSVLPQDLNNVTSGFVYFIATVIILAIVFWLVVLCRRRMKKPSPHVKQTLDGAINGPLRPLRNPSSEPFFPDESSL